MAKWPNYFISGKQFQNGQICQIWHLKGQMATLEQYIFGWLYLSQFQFISSLSQIMLLAQKWPKVTHK